MFSFSFLMRDTDELSVGLGLVDIINLLVCFDVVCVSGKLLVESVHLGARLVHQLHFLKNVLNINFLLKGYLFLGAAQSSQA
jgi:hypothetical protein